jgi:RND superfamily putative drug exporter
MDEGVPSVDFISFAPEMMGGVGLCVSVLNDATVIRAFVVPAVMALAGRWNWYPGRYRRP